MRRTLFAALALVAAACGGREGTPRRVLLATTTSTANSGLLEWLLDPFAEETGIRVDVRPVGTGEALAIGRRGDADVVLVHARALEDAFLAEGHGVDRRDVMWNDFLIAGPAEDPAGIRGLADSADALRRIAASGARFVSRADRSGTHAREMALWEAAGGRPAMDADAYLEPGQGMGACLTMAYEKRAYILTDRGTWLAYRAQRDIDLPALVEGDPRLANPYGVIRVNPDRHPGVNAEGGRALVAYLTSAAGQARIGAFRAGGEVLFHPAQGSE